MEANDRAHQPRCDQLINDLADGDRGCQHLNARAGILQGEHHTDDHDRQGAGIGNQGGEADQQGKHHAVGDLQQGEHHHLGQAEQQGQQHLPGEVAAERAVEAAHHQCAPVLRNPAGQTAGNRIAAQQQKHRQHQHDQGVDGDAQGGAQQPKQLLAQAAGQPCGPQQQVVGEGAQIGGPAPLIGKGLQAVELLLGLHQPPGQGIDQIAQLLQQQRCQHNRSKADPTDGDAQHQQQTQGPGQAALLQPASGDVEQEGDQRCSQKQGWKRRQPHQHLPQHK